MCATCGSTNVLADAYCDWSVDDQGWQIVNVFEKGAFCEDCEGPCRLKKRIVNDYGEKFEVED